MTTENKNDVTIPWPRKLAEELVKIACEENRQVRFQIAWELVNEAPVSERSSAQIAYLIARLKIATTLEEIWQLLDEATRINLLVPTVSHITNNSFSSIESLAIFKGSAVFVPANPKDRRLQALAKSFREALGRVKRSLREIAPSERKNNEKKSPREETPEQ